MRPSPTRVCCTSTKVQILARVYYLRAVFDLVLCDLCALAPVVRHHLRPNGVSTIYIYLCLHLYLYHIYLSMSMSISIPYISMSISISIPYISYVYIYIYTIYIYLCLYLYLYHIYLSMSISLSIYVYTTVFLKRMEPTTLHRSIYLNIRAIYAKLKASCTRSLRPHTLVA